MIYNPQTLQKLAFSPFTPDAQMAAQAAPQGGQPPMDPAMQGQGGAPQGASTQSFDPATGQTIDDATGMPVDPNTGMLVDPSTGQMIDPNTGAVAPGAQQMPMFDDPEIIAQVQDAVKEVPAISKELARVEKQQNAARNDLQSLRREIQTLTDNQDAVLNRIDNLVATIERISGVN